MAVSILGRVYLSIKLGTDYNKLYWVRGFYLQR